MKKLGTKKDQNSIKEQINETRDEFAAQSETMRVEVQDSVGKIEKFERAVLKMQQEMRARDEALRRVPSNTAQLLKDLKR